MARSAFAEERRVLRAMNEASRGLERRLLENHVATIRANDLLPRDLLSRLDSASEVFRQLQGAAQSALTEEQRVLRAMKEASVGLERVYRGFRVDIGAMSSVVELTRSRLASIDLVDAGQSIGAIGRQQEELARLTGRLVSRHADLVASIGRQTELARSVRLAACDLPTRAVFAHTSAVRCITPHVREEDEPEGQVGPLGDATIRETDDYLERELAKLKPAFLEQYRGVKQRGRSLGPDGWTQGSASMRKLLKGVLHSVAPNSSVLPWAERNNKELDRNGRPTRATKIEWLCRSISDESYRNFVRTELDSALVLIRVVDTAQHVDEFPEFAEQYDWIAARTAVCIRHMLVLWEPPGSQVSRSSH